MNRRMMDELVARRTRPEYTVTPGPSDATPAQAR
jgi:hypothetical protein